MYLGKYPENGEVPPGYRGVAITPEPRKERGECVERETCKACEKCEEREDKCEKTKGGFFDKFLSHHLDFEDLLLIGLILMLLWSGSDIECVLMLVLLFILGL